MQKVMNEDDRTFYESSSLKADDRQFSNNELFARAWVLSLNELMRANLASSTFFRFRYGNTDDTISSAVEIAIADNTTVICLYFGAQEDGGPTNIVAITNEKNGVTVIEHCEPWQFRSWIGAELVSERRRFRIEEGGGLKGRPNTLDEMRARRVAATWDRLRERAFEIAGRDLPKRTTTPRTSPAAQPRQRMLLDNPNDG